MFGSIMPAPLEIPVIVMVLPFTCTCSLTSLGRVSVVIIPSAAAGHSSKPKCSTATGILFSKGASANTSEITPVEKGSTSCGAQPVASATKAHVATARSSPSDPVPALAMPVLINRYLGVPCAKCRFATVTGAAQKRFLVNTAATELPSSISTSTKSRQLCFLMPPRTADSLNPAIGNPIKLPPNQACRDNAYIFYLSHSDRAHYGLFCA